MLRCLRPLILVVALGFSVPVSADEPDVVLRDYVVKKGDSCLGIAIRELGDRKAYKLIHKYNPLGPLPHNLKPGSILRLPSKKPAGPDAKLSAQRGDVAVRTPRATSWASAILGMDLFRRWRVNARKRSTAEVTFTDSSRLRLRENTLVIIYGPTATRARRRTRRASLERGTLRSRLAELDGKKPELLVETPSSETELGSGSALVSVDSQATRVSNHEGTSAKVKSRKKRKKRRRKTVSVAPGMGSKIEKDKEPSPPVPLPPTPSWASPSKGFVGWAHLGATVSAGWQSVAKAEEYRVEISRDDKGADVITSVTVPKNVTRFEAHGFPAGVYYATVASRDADKFESAPSAVLTMTVEPITVAPFGKTQALGVLGLAPDQALDASNQLPPFAVLVGSRLTPPAGVTCAIGEGPSTTELVLPAVGPQTIACKRGATTLEPVVVVGVALEARALIAGNPSRRLLERDKDVEVEVRFAEALPFEPALLAVSASPGVTIVSRRDEPGSIRLVVRAGSGAPNSGDVQVTYGVDGPMLLRVPLDVERRVERRAQAPIDPRPAARRRWEIGALAGGTLVDDEFQLGNSSAASGVLDSGWIVGARLALHATPRFFVEGEGTYAEPGFVGLADHANVIGYRFHGGLFLREGRLRPFVVGGFGGSFLNTNSSQAQNDTDKELHWGLGLTWLRGARSRLRLDVRHRFAEGRVSNYSNLFEASLGIGWML